MPLEWRDLLRCKLVEEQLWGFWSHVILSVKLWLYIFMTTSEHYHLNREDDDDERSCCCLLCVDVSTVDSWWGGFAWFFQHLCLYDDDLVLAQNEDQNYAVLILWNDSLTLQQIAMTKICT